MMTNQLTIVEKDEQLVVSSVDVAEMTGKNHKNLMRDIRGYVDALNDEDGHGSILSSENFFVEGTYINSRNQIQPCYYLTRKGCDMVANKMTGKKGIQFTAVYVERFYEMENQLKQELQPKLPATYKEALLALVEAEEDKERLMLENQKKQEVVDVVTKEKLVINPRKTINVLVKAMARKLDVLHSEAWRIFYSAFNTKHSTNLALRKGKGNNLDKMTDEEKHDAVAMMLSIFEKKGWEHNSLLIFEGVEEEESWLKQLGLD